MNIEDTIKNKRKFDLEDRLINFAIRISELAEALPNTALGKYLMSESYIYPSADGHVSDYWRMKIKKHYL